ncbi:MAG: glycosyl hydrolase family 2 [Acidobacteria bacterium]|nr:MAG: glycosyl hydrolase family 2 [Acidobacteriota bacterium]
MNRLLLFGSVLLLATHALAQTARTAEPTKLPLKHNWWLQSSAQVQAQGDNISRNGFQIQGWYPTTVPATVVAALVNYKVYPDPYFGVNLRQLPGANYPTGKIFSRLPMPDGSPFKVAWWYRTEFQLPASERGRTIWLHFDGINYRANIWLNGRLLADNRQVAGAFRTYEFDVTNFVRPGARNTLALEINAPTETDLGINWVDWNPTPPDKNMGLWREVYLTMSGPVALRYPQVVTHFDAGRLDLAHLIVNAELHNATDKQVTGVLRGRLDRISFQQTVALAPHETKSVSFTPERFPQLNLAHPRLWWPTGMGAQNLYDLHTEFIVNGASSDQQTTHFGVREITSELDAQNHRFFRVNGRRVLVRGGGWSLDMLLRPNAERTENEIRYVRDMGLNAIRLEGKLEFDYLFDLADRYGILVIAGWCCCDQWEMWDKWDAEDHEVSAASQHDQIMRLRHHPSLLVWLNGSDGPPPADVEQRYISILQSCQWPNPYISSASAKPTSVTGASGVKMTGPYDWVPPSYWLLDTQNGGAYGFNTETSPGPAVPPVSSLRKFIPADHLWPIDDVWLYHAGGGQFKTLKIFNDAMDARYGRATSLDDYVMKSQLMTYDGERAMFEAYARNRERAGGVVQWMLNNAWPSLIWHLYDYYLLPAGGYFGTKKACEPLHVQYSYDDRSVVVVNTTDRNLRGARVTASVHNLDLHERYTRTDRISIAPDSSTAVFTIPQLPNLSATYFVRLTLHDAAGQLLSDNLYWLSTKQDALDFVKSTWYYTPLTAYADLTALKNLPPAHLNVTAHTERRGAEEFAHIRLVNTSNTLAFFVRLHLTRGRNGDDLVPLLWQDNYISLLPGEARDTTATYKLKDLHGTQPALTIIGWNVPPQTQMLAPPSKH